MGSELIKLQHIAYTSNALTCDKQTDLLNHVFLAANSQTMAESKFGRGISIRKVGINLGFMSKAEPSRNYWENPGFTTVLLGNSGNIG